MHTSKQLFLGALAVYGHGGHVGCVKLRRLTLEADAADAGRVVQVIKAGLARLLLLALLTGRSDLEIGLDVAAQIVHVISNIKI